MSPHLPKVESKPKQFVYISSSPVLHRQLRRDSQASPQPRGQRQRQGQRAVDSLARSSYVWSYQPGEDPHPAVGGFLCLPLSASLI